ncbi:MAG: hypothetical protein AAB305_06420 [Candidatus Zixiibacteriota bacterium]
MFKRNVTIGAILSVMVTAIGIQWGCNSTPSDSGVHESTEAVQSENAGTGTISVSWLSSEASERTTALTNALDDPNVRFAHSWLNGQGYTFVDTNSIVIINHDLECRSLTIEPHENRPSASADDGPCPGMKQVIARADTMVWQAFENPTHDMANHTAVITMWSGNGGKRTIFLELDVSVAPAVGVRKGGVINQEIIPQDPSMDGFFECVGEDVVEAAGLCLISNCAWAKCTGAAAGISIISCGIKAIFAD